MKRTCVFELQRKGLAFGFAKLYTDRTAYFLIWLFIFISRLFTHLFMYLFVHSFHLSSLCSSCIRASIFVLFHLFPFLRLFIYRQLFIHNSLFHSIIIMWFIQSYIHSFVRLLIYLFVHLFIYLFTHLFMYVRIYLFPYLFTDNSYMLSVAAVYLLAPCQAVCLKTLLWSLQ